jgi:hypothetical protein
MKKHAINVIAVAMLLSLTMSISASAGVLRASQYLSSYSVWTTATGSGHIKVDFDVSATGMADSVGVTKIVLQRKSGSSWTNVYTFNSSSTSGMLGSNRLFHCGDVTYNGTSGSEYRAVVTVYSKIGSGSDSREVTTNSVIG